MCNVESPLGCEAAEHQQATEEGDNVHVGELPRGADGGAVDCEGLAVMQCAERGYFVADSYWLVEILEGDPERVARVGDGFDDAWIGADDRSSQRDRVAHVWIWVLGDLIFIRVSVHRWIGTECAGPQKRRKQHGRKHDKGEKTDTLAIQFQRWHLVGSLSHEW